MGAGRPTGSARSGDRSSLAIATTRDGGGGASDVRRAPWVLADRLAVAGGGGEVGTWTFEAELGGGGGGRVGGLVTFENLVPGGVCSLFSTTFGPDSKHPLCPDVEQSVPVHTVFPADRPDPSSFVADGAGRASYVGRIEGAILDTTLVSLQVVYHADGRTYHPLPNRREFETQGELCRDSWGIDAMRQLHILQQWIL